MRVRLWVRLWTEVEVVMGLWSTKRCTYGYDRFHKLIVSCKLFSLLLVFVGSVVFSRIPKTITPLVEIITPIQSGVFDALIYANKRIYTNRDSGKVSIVHL